jgi:GH25 family lysozyme M1 (1,4-beta-N-acetylmuramidase)
MKPLVLAAASLLLCLNSCAPPTADEDWEEADDDAQAVQLCADGPTVKGIDVSEFQGSVNWPAVRADGVRYAFIRVSDGTTFKDQRFAQNWAGAKSAGVLRGAYQFFRANQDPKAQAELLLASMGPLDASDFPPVLDVETSNGVAGASVLAKVRTWLDIVETKTGRKPLIYTSIGFWETLPAAPDLAEYPLWVANYGVSCPHIPEEWSRWTFWQKTDTGSVAGISGGVDVNAFNGTFADLEQFRDGEKSTLPLAIGWTRQADGRYDFRTEAAAEVVRVDYRVDGFSVGGATRFLGADFPDSYSFSLEKTGRLFEVVGFDDEDQEIARGRGLLDVTPETAVFIRQAGDKIYEIGLERAPSGVAAIEVRADGFLLVDGVSGKSRSSRLAVKSTFGTLGERNFALTTFNADGSKRGTLKRTFTLK